MANEIDPSPADTEITKLAGFLAVSVQGLWAHGRVTKSNKDLKKKTETLIELVKFKLADTGG